MGCVDELCVAGAFPRGGIELTFWDHASETFTHPRNPLLVDGPLSIADMLPDEMHALHLGVFHSFISTVLWRVLRSNCYDLPVCVADELRFRGSLRMKADLQRWYRDEKRLRPDKPLYEIRDFCAATLGDAEGAAVRAKAAESGTLMAFSVFLARKFRDRLPQGGPLLACGEALLQYMQITREHGWKVPLPACQQLVDCCSRAMTLREVAGIRWIPK